MPDLGKAYVQIVPSAEGISGSISNLLGGEVESAGQQAGESLGSKLMGVAKKVIAAAGIGKARGITAVSWRCRDTVQGQCRPRKAVCIAGVQDHRTERKSVHGERYGLLSIAITVSRR